MTPCFGSSSSGVGAAEAAPVPIAAVAIALIVCVRFFMIGSAIALTLLRVLEGEQDGKYERVFGELGVRRVT
jgi:hypothetical protein